MSAFGFHCTGLRRARRPGCATKASYVLEQGDIRFVVSGALDGRLADRRARAQARRRRARPRLAGRRRRAPRYAAAVGRGARRVRAPWTETDDDGELELAQVGRVRRHRAHVRRPQPLSRRRCSSPATPPSGLPNPTVGPRRRPDARSTTSSATSSRASSTTGCASTPTSSASPQLLHFDDDQIRTEYSALDVDGGVGRPASGTRACVFFCQSSK